MVKQKKTEKRNTAILIKSGFWYTASNFLTKSIAFITIPFFTRIMSKQEYADFSVFASWQSIFLIVCGMEIYATLNRARFDYDTEQTLDSYISSCLLLSTIFTVAIFSFYLLHQSFFDKLFLLDRKYIFIMFGYLFTQPAFQMFQAKQRVEYRYKLSAGLSFFLVIFSTLFAVYLVQTGDDKLLGRIVGQFLPYIIVGIVFYGYFITKSRSVSLTSCKYALKMGIPLVFSFLGSQILLSSDRVVVQHICSHEEVAWLVLATSGAHIILLFVQALNNAWAPWFFDKLREGCKEQIRKIFCIYMWFVVCCTFFVLLLGPEIVQVLGGTAYSQSVYVLPANMLCGIFTVITAQFVNLQTYYKKTGYAAILTAIAAVINVIGDFVGVKLFGYQAACYVTVICQLFLIGLHYLVSLKFGIKEIMPWGQIASVLGTGLLLIPVSLFCYRFWTFRIVVASSLVVGMAVVVYIKRTAMMKVLCSIKNSK